MRKYEQKRLAQYRKRTEVVKGKGDMIVLVDESGSTYEVQAWAKAFALAMLDQENSGFVLNAIHSREGCYTYIKEIVKGESYIVLGEEEKEALRQAVNMYVE